jgi:transcriptional regulator with GAF, ATPase, and Fis domain
MWADVLCAGLPALLEGASAALPDARLTGLGIVRAAESGRVLFAYVDAFGSTAYAARAVDLPSALRPRAAELQELTPNEFAANPAGLVESRLTHGGLAPEFTQPHRLERIVTLPVSGVVPSLLVAGFGAPAREPGETDALAALCDQMKRLLTRKEPPEEELERLRRLESAERLLPALFHVLDVRQIFDRLSAITNDVVRHDFMSVGLFNDSLTQISLFAGTSTLAMQEYSGPMPYPPSQTRTWLCRFVPDLLAHPVDRQADLSARDGGRCSIRIAIRSGDLTIGALNFTSRQLAQYKALDLAIARRVADYVALAISHQRQAEEGRKAAALEERNARLEVRVKTLTDELDSRSGFRRMAGESKAWKDVLVQTTKVAATGTTVLLSGESGTGKEVVARFLHRASGRSHGPFVALNCAALPEQLLEAELFGYERGAYTGATQSKPGQLEQASGGTLFLDEVGEMSLAAQAKFLRVLQEQEFQRLGGTRVLRSDARIIAATNRDLQQAIAEGRFREDLFYRLHVFAIALPPLRERVDDILPLSTAFLAEFAQRSGRGPSALSSEAKRLLLEHGWPGNVRELRNALERASILCDDNLITPEHLTFATRSPSARPSMVPQPPVVPVPAVDTVKRSSAPPAAAGDLEIVERTMIEQALHESRFNKSKAAKALGLTRTQLYVRLRRYGLE